MKPDTRLVRTKKILASPIDDELVMFDSDAGKYYGMNTVASVIWNNLEESKTIEEMCDILTGKFDISKEKCLEELIGFLPDLEKRGLIQFEFMP